MPEDTQTSLGQISAAPEQTRSRTFPARADQVRRARWFIRQFLSGSPAADDAILVCSELAANAVLHSGSARPGGTFTVRARTDNSSATWIEVEDQGGPWPAARLDPQDGHGLCIVAALTSHWAISDDDTRRVVSARIDWP